MSVLQYAENKTQFWKILIMRIKNPGLSYTCIMYGYMLTQEIPIVFSLSLQNIVVALFPLKLLV